MSSSYPTTSLTVKSRGINYGLPTYSPSVKGSNALVFGANGISGNNMDTAELLKHHQIRAHVGRYISNLLRVLTRIAMW
ncbi:hypothetical protein TrVFT333_006494 [Trichoderma virens FT-333]|nr:hypothetical protein TrVFT333_006494 [Trichoderma virens FT-333]